MTVSSGLIPATVLRTEDDVRRFDRRRRADRSLPPAPQHPERIAERAPNGVQASSPLDASPEPSHERIGSLIAGAIVFATSDARKVG